MADGQPEIARSARERDVCSYYSSPIAEGRLHQGEILCNVGEWCPSYDEQGGVIAVGPVIHRLAVIVTQDCDLEKDFRQRNDDMMAEEDLRSILLCPIEPSEGLRAVLKARGFAGRLWSLVQSNKNERYQYLAEIPADVRPANDATGPFVVDFVSCFTVRTVELYRQIRSTREQSTKRLAVLKTPWREHLQQRFTNYLARVGLPIDHFIPEGRRAEPRPSTTNSHAEPAAPGPAASGTR